jgi:hypothetical protein
MRRVPPTAPRVRILQRSHDLLLGQPRAVTLDQQRDAAAIIDGAAQLIASSSVLNSFNRWRSFSKGAMDCEPRGPE